MPDLTISLIQTDLLWEDPERNLDHLSSVMDQMDTPVDLIILPEMFNTGFSIHPERFAEKMDGRTVAFLRSQAKKKNCILCGSLMVEENGKFYNRLCWATPDGSVIHYDKRHLFRLSDESKVFTAGNTKKVLMLKGWKILPLICYDLRFPVWSKNTWSSGKGYDYDLLLYVANWPESRSHVWKTLLMARAIENQIYVAGVNRIGTDGEGTTYSGESMFIDPKGRILKEAGKYKTAIMTTVLPFGELQKFRDSFQIGLDWDQFTIES